MAAGRPATGLTLAVKNPRRILSRQRGTMGRAKQLQVPLAQGESQCDALRGFESSQGFAIFQTQAISYALHPQVHYSRPLLTE